MNEDINKLFEIKNKEILINSLVLEMEKNIDTLKNTVDNCLSLEINKLIIFMKKYFSEIGTKYTKESILTLLYNEKNTLNKIIEKETNIKKENIKNKYLEKVKKDEMFTEEELNNYFVILREETKQFLKNLEPEIDNEIINCFYIKVLKEHSITEQEHLERLSSRINNLFKDTVLEKIKIESEFRDESLKNMAEASFKKYLSLNEQTIDIA